MRRSGICMMIGTDERLDIMRSWAPCNRQTAAWSLFFDLCFPVGNREMSKIMEKVHWLLAFYKIVECMRGRMSLLSDLTSRREGRVAGIEKVTARCRADSVHEDDPITVRKRWVHAVICVLKQYICDFEVQALGLPGLRAVYLQEEKTLTACRKLYWVQIRLGREAAHEVRSVNLASWV